MADNKNNTDILGSFVNIDIEMPKLTDTIKKFGWETPMDNKTWVNDDLEDESTSVRTIPYYKWIKSGKRVFCLPYLSA